MKNRILEDEIEGKKEDNEIDEEFEDLENDDQDIDDYEDRKFNWFIRNYPWRKPPPELFY